MNERERAITNLMAVDLSGGSHEMLSSIAKAIYKPTCGGWTIGACQVLRDTLVNLLSETDEETLREAYTKGREDGMAMTNAKDAQAEYLRGKNDGYDEGYDAGFASADDWCAQHEDEMEKHGWYRALAADKATIRIGDKVDSDHHEDGTVMGIQFYEMPRGIRTLVAVRPDGWDVATWHMPDDYRHRAHTVEDTLHELIGKALMLSEVDGENELVAEYAAKLRGLAGDAE